VPKWVELGGAATRVANKLAALDLSYDDGDEDVGSGARVTPEPGDKLLGWPCWIQAAPRISCPRCKKAMRHVFQIDSETNVPWSWGDAGAAWLFQCPSHPDALALEWQCH
jgi:uncharacterized protein YwqG